MNKNCHKIDREATDKEKFQKSRFEHKDTIAKYFTAFLQNYPMDNFDRINEFVVLYELVNSKLLWRYL